MTLCTKPKLVRFIYSGIRRTISLPERLAYSFLSVLAMNTHVGTGDFWIKWRLFSGSKKILNALVETQDLSRSLVHLQDLALYLHM